MLNEKDPKETELCQKESGFNLYVNGAHKLPERQTPRHLISNSSTKYKKQIAMVPNFVPKIHIKKSQDNNNNNNNNNNKSEDRCKSAPGSRRKQWLMSSITIKTMDGLNIKLYSPENMHSMTQRDGNKQTNENYYSDDFVTDSSDDEFKFKASTSSSNSELPSHLIKSVKFSSSSSSIASDIEEEKNENKKNKKCLKLSKADVKVNQ